MHLWYKLIFYVLIAVRSFQALQRGTSHVHGVRPEYMLQCNDGKPTAPGPYAALCLVSCSSYIHIKLCLSYICLHRLSTIKYFRVRGRDRMVFMFSSIIYSYLSWEVFCLITYKANFLYLLPHNPAVVSHKNCKLIEKSCTYKALDEPSIIAKDL